MEKTKVTHIEEGFDFLGWNFRKYDGKLLIKPSKKNVKAFLGKIRETVKENKAAKQENLIGLLNPMIRGWANYLDLDHFKRFNDACGHEAGDTVLRAVGDLLRRSLRASDVICRYGGEELTVVMPDSSLDDARTRLDALRQAVMRLTLLQAEGASLPAITVSIGVALAAAEETDATVLLGRADAALYQAKAQGRNRVVVADPGL